MTQGERVKSLRKALNMTLAQFGKKLGVGNTAISKIEHDENALTEQMSKLICREFNVNSEWLATGNGEMFTDLPQTILDEICLQYDLDDFERGLITEYLKLSPRDRQVLKNYIRSVVDHVDDTDDIQARIDKEVEAYRRELELQARQAEKSSHRDDTSTESGEKMA